MSKSHAPQQGGERRQPEPAPSGPAPSAGGSAFEPAEAQDKLGNSALVGMVHRLATGTADAEDPEGVFADATASPSTALPYRDKMESAFGADLSGVRAHTGLQGALGSMGAQAATDGQSIAFGSTSPDEETVAHEVAHVVQNQRAGGGAGVQGRGGLSDPNAASEREAETAAQAYSRGDTPKISAAPTADIQREGEDTSDPTVQTETRGGCTWSVQPGDTLWAIAQQVYGDPTLWPRIAEANSDKVGDGGRRIGVGDELHVPAVEVGIACVDPDSQGFEPQSLQSEGPTDSTDANTDTSSESTPDQDASNSTSSESGEPASSSASTSGDQAAFFPVIEFPLQNLPTQPIPPIVTPAYTVTGSFSLKGKLKMQAIGGMNNMSISPEAIEAQASTKLDSITSGMSVSMNSTDQVSLKSSLAGDFGSTSMELRSAIPPTIAYSAAPKPVAFSADGWQVEGELGYEMELTFIPNPSQPVPVKRPWYERVGEWISDHGPEIAVGAVIVVGVGAAIYFSGGLATPLVAPAFGS